MSRQFLSCDWGTSSFRLRLVNSEDSSVIAEMIDGRGIASVHHQWNQSGLPKGDRISFYKNILLSGIKALNSGPLTGVSVIISGMASSSIGMIELPYTNIPFSFCDTNLHVHKIAADDRFLHDIFIVSGLRTTSDVMRGEETMLYGCEIGKGDHLVIFPGTHSKHVIVHNHIVKGFKTYMTGELFDLLINKSILAGSVEKENLSELNKHHFINGVNDALSSHLLNNIFHIRTNQLFGKLGKKENYLYLSGLIIGEELKNIPIENNRPVTVVSSGILSCLYSEALLALGIKDKLVLQNEDAALIRGQTVMLNQYE